MPDVMDLDLEPCERPSDEELAGLEVPFRPYAQGNGWYAHYFYRPGGAPAYKRLTHGDHDDVWFRPAVPV